MDNLNTFAREVARCRRAVTPALRGDVLACERWMRLPGQVPPWQPTGCHVQAGQQYSLFAGGRIRWSRTHPDRHGGPSFHLWARVRPGGRCVNLAANSGTFTADVSGEIELGIYMGRWRDAAGTLATSHDLYARLSGELGCWLVVWRHAALTDLARLRAAVPASILAAEEARLAAPVTPPAGWDYLLDTGQSEIFRESVCDGHRAIEIEARDDQGILITPVDVPLTPATRLQWTWCADALPSTLAEDRTHTHDYVAIAAEFDDGRDLTWNWSAALPPETYFACPVPAWRARETHLVVRCGNPVPGRWYTESRAVHADVARSMGMPAGRIVRVWLIALATFQHGVARARFRDIAFEFDDHRVRVL
ncbi:MAG: DUF3047 domain-containing protein [Gammaproteobacteria bacterium]